MADLVLIKPPALYGARLETQNTAIRFDSTLSEGHEQTAKITQHPVERGVDISDHHRPNPFKLKLGGTITATPLRKVDQEPDRLRKIHQELLDLVRSGATMRVVTGLSAYDDVQIASYKADRNPTTGHAMGYQMELMQVRRVATAAVDIPADILKANVRAGGQSKKDKGQQTGEQAQDGSAEDKRGKTWAASIGDFLFD